MLKAAISVSFPSLGASASSTPPRTHLEAPRRPRAFTVLMVFLLSASCVALADQTGQDLMWIREEFLESNADFGKLVVHGHTITDAPQVAANRIGIDTGAFYSGKLTALALEGVERAFIQT